MINKTTTCLALLSGIANGFLSIPAKLPIGLRRPASIQSEEIFRVLEESLARSAGSEREDTTAPDTPRTSEALEKAWARKEEEELARRGFEAFFLREVEATTSTTELAEASEPGSEPGSDLATSPAAAWLDAGFLWPRALLLGCAVLYG